MDIQDYVNVLWRRKWIVILTTVAAVVVAVVGTRIVKPTYEASTTIRVATSASGTLGTTAASVSNQLVNTAAQIAASRPMMDQLMTRLNLKNEPGITSAVIPQTELIKITVSYSDAQTAAKIANTLAGMLIEQSNQLYTGGTVSSLDLLATQVAQYQSDLAESRAAFGILAALTPPAPDRVAAARDSLQLKERNYETVLLEYNDALMQQQVRANMITVVEAAVPPGSPAAPQATYNYLIGLVLGLFFGIVLAFLAESFDPTLYTSRQVESAAALNVIARIPRAPNGEVRMLPNATSSLAEAYRSLATNMIGGSRQHPERVVLITSAEPLQGKSTATANLATALAERGMNVAAVDCDMRRPRLHELFSLANESGLANVLESETEIKNALQHPADCISVLTSGEQPANPSQLLSSPKMARVVNELRQQFDFVLLDTPALLAVSDTQAIMHNAELAQHLDAFFVVVRQAHAQHNPVEAASKLVKKFADGSAGIILDEADNLPGYRYYSTQTQQKMGTS